MAKHGQHQRQLRRQAAQIANAGLPSIHSINRQYGRSIKDVGGFGQGLLAALRAAGTQSSGAYDDAIAQQQQIDQTASDRLGNALGPAYAGAATAVGAAGDSAASRLAAQSAAAGGYQAKLPAIAASRTRVAQEGLVNSRQDAISQRADAFKSAFGPALQQVTTNDFNERMALKQFGLQKSGLALQQQQLALSQQQAAAENRRADASLALEGQRLTDSEQQWAAEFGARYGFNPYTGKKIKGVGGAGGGGEPWKKMNLTSSQFYGYRKTATTALSPSSSAERVPLYGQIDPATHKPVPSSISVGVKPSGDGYQIVGYRTYEAGRSGWVAQGKPFGQAISDLMGQGVPRPIAIWAAVRVYRQAQGAQPGSPAYTAYQSYFNFIAGQGQAAPNYNGPH